MDFSSITTISVVLGGIVSIISSILYLSNMIKKMISPITNRFDAIEKAIKDNHTEIDSRLNEINDVLDVQREGLLNTVRQSLLKSGDDYIAKGYITLNQLESLKSGYDAYANLGGDSFITDIVEKCKQLPNQKPKTKSTKK